MSEPRLVTPLLADHIMGEPISDHFGIRCCPALHRESEEKYIVKVISIPASQRQLDALLLSGAYGSAEEAREYFRTLAEETAGEARTLQKLSKLEGFWGCEGWQMEPTEDGTGFEIYLLSRYGATLERHLRRQGLTHLAAVNLGLDLCAALSVSRRNGWLYVNLKPENIILSDTKGYLIADLGFLSLGSLKYASLPDKYRSAYTAPEIQDAYSTLNTTLDTYAVGLILYQVFNGGALPQDLKEPAAYADPDMTEILRKACAEAPADRWQDPEEMAQALVGYMQSHTVNDTPIVPLPEPEPEVIEPDAVPEEPASEVEEVEEVSAIPAPEVEEPEAFTEESAPEVEELAEEEPAPESPVEESPAEESPVDEALPVDEAAAEECPAEESEEEPEEDVEPEQFVIEGFLFDDNLQDAEAVAQLSDDVISDEVSEMLAQADELIAHQAPDPVVAPEAIEVPMPEPILPEPEPEPQPEPDSEPEEEPAETEQPQTDPEPEEEEEPEEPEYVAQPKKRRLGLVITVLALILAALLAGVGGKYYYDNYYLQNIAGITLDGSQDWLTVTLDTQIDNSLLTVTATDTYGNRLTRSVENNRAVFTDLASGTAYRIEVVISGRHQLTGITTGTYTSDAQTTIQDFKAIAGSTDGSVILSFSVQGPDCESGWLVKYSAEGTQELTVPCNSHSATISGLEVGKTYTFRLIPKEALYLVGNDSTQFTAVAVVMPQNLTIRGFENNALLADWEIPAGAQVNSWTVRCYNSTGYDATYTVTEPSISIADLDVSQSYTLEVKAEGMLEGKQVTVSAGSVTFKEMLFLTSTGTLEISWPYEGTAPEGGWTLVYTVDGGEAISVNCSSNSYILENPIPASVYHFTVVLPEQISHFGGTGTYTIPQAPLFSFYGITNNQLQANLCINPVLENWTHADVGQDGYSNQFFVNQAAGCVLFLDGELTPSEEEITITWILRNPDGTFLECSSTTAIWDQLWLENYCCLDLPFLLDTPGEFTLDLLLNNGRVTDEPLTVTVIEPPVEEPPVDDPTQTPETEE